MSGNLSLDAGRCVGHGRCYSLAPDVYEPDEEGHCVIRISAVTTADLEAQARLAVANCPEQALAFEEV